MKAIEKRHKRLLSLVIITNLLTLKIMLHKTITLSPFNLILIVNQQLMCKDFLQQINKFCNFYFMAFG